MRRLVSVVATAVLLAGLGAIPAAAEIDANPNAEELTNLVCPEAELSFDAIWSPALQSVSGHDLENNLVGVAKSLWVTDDEGTPIEAFLVTPGKGLAKLTVWCFWYDSFSPTGFLGGDILFNANVRP